MIPMVPGAPDSSGHTPDIRLHVASEGNLIADGVAEARTSILSENRLRVNAGFVVCQELNVAPPSTLACRLTVSAS